MPTPHFISASAPGSFLFSVGSASGFDSPSLGGSVGAAVGVSGFGGGVEKIPLVSAAKISILFATSCKVVLGSLY